MFQMAWLVASIAIFCAGIIFLTFGINSSNSIFEKFIETFTGRYSEETMAYIIGGIISTVTGISLLVALSIKKIVSLRKT